MTHCLERLVLFDVDGTLLTTRGAAHRAFEASLLEVFGTAGPIDTHSFAGKTDPQIVTELMEAAGVGADLVAAALPALWECYTGRLERELATADLHVFPGVRRLLSHLEAPGSPLLPGLLTGNIEAGARFKLDAAGIGFSRFALGAFGSDHGDRGHLPAVALERALRLTGRRFTGEQVVIVGDTPADIECGRGLDCRTIAVATGVYSARQLAACAPDYLFPTLEDREAVVTALMA